MLLGRAYLVSIMTALLLTPAAAGEFPVRGVVKPVNEAEISSKVVAGILDLPFREGEFFKKGDTLIKFDCTDLSAQKRVLNAVRKSAQLKVKNNLILRQHNAIGALDLEISKAELQKAVAEVTRIQVNLNKCNIKAPFDGVVNEVKVTKAETPAVGTSLMHIIGNKKREIELIVPSNWLDWVKPGTPFEFVIEETGKSYSGKVVRLDAAIDPVSQTIQLFGKFASDASQVMPGMSGAARFMVPQDKQG